MKTLPIWGIVLSNDILVRDNYGRARILILELFLSGCVTLRCMTQGGSLKLSKLLFPHL